MNKVMLIGNLGKDVELRYSANQTAISNLSVATSETIKVNGEKKDKTEWHTVVVFGKVAENCAKYLAKGRSVAIVGRLQTRKYQDKEGTDRYVTEIIADEVEFLGGKTQEKSARETVKQIVNKQNDEQWLANDENELDSTTDEEEETPVPVQPPLPRSRTRKILTEN